MEKAEAKREKLYFSMNKFVNGNRNYEFFDENEKEEEIELCLGLSLNGKFGADLQREKRLKRCSSVTNFVPGSNINGCSSVTNFVPGSNINGNYYGFQIPVIDTCQIGRTCSLPVETEEEWRKRKELESLRRLEAKRKRLEKMKSNVKVAKKENEVKNGKCCCYDSNYGEVCGGNSLGSSQGGGSSGILDFESHQPIKGPSDSTEARPPASGQSPDNLCQATGQSPEHEKKPIATSPETTSDKSPVTPSTIGKEAKEMLRNFMLHMPCVSTRGDGPNGKKIEGFLYGYTKGEEVRIVCVCHGTFLSPAEFVKHAGGGDVAHPLRHIVVNPSPLL